MKKVQSLLPQTFARDGYQIVRGLCPESVRDALRAMTLTHLEPLVGPVEYEADVGYPGAPGGRDEQGGSTPRRLLNAYSRAEVFREWATGPLVGDRLRTLFGRDDLFVSQCHHNCVMTKYPGYSSATLWHQDIRYWSFDRPDLVSVWLALGGEREENGGLSLIAGSHLIELDRGRLDAELFLRPELEENHRMIATARSVELDFGDVVFFHSGLFHAAGMNRTAEVKLSVVFTYHAADNHPIPDTKSSSYPSIQV